jgi:hypothetical protein
MTETLTVTSCAKRAAFTRALGAARVKTSWSFASTRKIRVIRTVRFVIRLGSGYDMEVISVCAVLIGLIQGFQVYYGVTGVYHGSIGVIMGLLGL